MIHRDQAVADAGETIKSQVIEIIEALDALIAAGVAKGECGGILYRFPPDTSDMAKFTVQGEYIKNGWKAALMHGPSDKDCIKLD